MTGSTDDMTIDEFDKYIDDGGDVSDLFENAIVERPGRAQRRVSLDMNEPTIVRLDRYAREYGVPRQALIKVWLVERLNSEDDRKLRAKVG